MDISYESPPNTNYEVNSYVNTLEFNSIFGLDVYDLYDPEELSDIVENPMANNYQLRKLSNRLYASNGLFSKAVDYLTAMPTLDYVIIPRGNSKNKRKINKNLMDSTLRTIHHKEFIRDALFKAIIDGVSFYYVDFTKRKDDQNKLLTDYEVTNIMEINELGVNAVVFPLPTDFTKIVGRKNSSYVLAFNLDYFSKFSPNELKRKLRLYPKEIKEAWEKLSKQKDKDGKRNWVVLDNSKTITLKIRSKMEEPWGRPLCLAAIKNILYASYFKDTKRSKLGELNNNIIYQTFPEGKEKGTSALTKKQQEDQHNAVKTAILTKNNRNSTSFFSVAAGTKIDQIKVDTSIFDEKNESKLLDDIGVDLGFMASLLSGGTSGSYAAQLNNLQLLLSEVFMWIEPITLELVKVINQNIIKDKKNPVDLYYLPCSIITRKEFTNQMKELYLQGKGSLIAWIASTGFNADAYLTLMDMEIEEGFEKKYVPHQTSFTLSKNDNKGGRPQVDSPTNENTIQSKTNNSNGQPKPSNQ
ncbi:MAG TPA: hypothetical protein PK887_11210 [Ignavibacteriales bacterium]|nr:hypothetical protein [Ignavibacteriales bacterium]